MYSAKSTSILPKVISGVLATLLLLPLLIFTALPNTVFGYTSATDQGVVDFTASAQRLNNTYQNLERKKQSALERLVNNILPGFSGSQVVILNAKEHEAPRTGRFGSIAFIFLYHNRAGKSSGRAKR